LYIVSNVNIKTLTSGTTTSLSFSVILVETARSHIQFDGDHIRLIEIKVIPLSCTHYTFVHCFKCKLEILTSGTTTSLSFSVILVETAKSMSMLSHSVTPMAYRSLNTLAQAILPEMKQNKIKSLKLIFFCESFEDLKMLLYLGVR
jgi:hypothetical protein